MEINKIERNGVNQGNITLTLSLDEYNNLYKTVYCYDRDNPDSPSKEIRAKILTQMRFAREMLNYGKITRDAIVTTTGVIQEEWKYHDNF
jgi:hypothetical protein